MHVCTRVYEYMYMHIHICIFKCATTTEDSGKPKLEWPGQRQRPWSASGQLRCCSPWYLAYPPAGSHQLLRKSKYSRTWWRLTTDVCRRNQVTLMCFTNGLESAPAAAETRETVCSIRHPGTFSTKRFPSEGVVKMPAVFPRLDVWRPWA